MISFKNEYLITDEILPVRNHQAYEELMKFQKEFASEIYIQKDRDGKIP